MSAPVSAMPPLTEKKLEKKPIKFSNLLLGAGLNMFEVTTLGQPLEVVKTTMASHRGDGVSTALSRVWSRGGVFGCRCPQLRAPLPQSRRCPSSHGRPLMTDPLPSLPGSHPLGLD